MKNADREPKKETSTGKRGFLRFAGLTALVSILDKFLLRSALASTWQKLDIAMVSALNMTSELSRLDKPIHVLRDRTVK